MRRFQRYRRHLINRTLRLPGPLFAFDADELRLALEADRL